MLADAVQPAHRKACQGESEVVTRGTGSGKGLTYSLPLQRGCDRLSLRPGLFLYTEHLCVLR